MAVHPIYIDSDEEILEVVERLRSTTTDEVPLVLPGRSRVGSRFNLQLLRQYALRMGKRVAIISPDPGVKSMARDNGFAAYSALEEYSDFEPVAPPRDRLPTEFAATEFAPRPVEPQRRAAPVTPPPQRPSPVAEPPAPPRRRDRLVSAAATSDEAAAIAAPQRRWELPPGAASGEWSLPNVGLGSLRNRMLYGGAAAVLLLGLFLMALYVPSADVTIVATARPFAKTATFTVGAGDPSIRLRSVTVDKQSQQAFPATGQKDNPAQAATGSVTYNNQCPFGLQIHQGQKLDDSSGHQFIQQADVNLDNGSTASAPIKAAQPGAAGNVDANTITKIEFTGTTQALSSCLTATNPNPTTGGTDDKKQKQVTQQDLDHAKSVLQQQLQQQVTSDVAHQANSGEQVANKVAVAVTDFTTDHQKDDIADSFNASMSVEGKGVFFLPDDVKKALVDNLNNNMESGYALTDNGVSTAYTVTSVTGDGRVTFQGRAAGYIAPRLDYSAIKDQLSGHSPDAAHRYLATLPVRSTTIKEHPFPLPFLPFLGSRINVSYTVDTPQG